MIKQFGQGSCSGFPAFLPRLRIKIAIFGVCWWTEYVRTLNLSITRVLKVMLRWKISKRKKRKKKKVLHSTGGKMRCNIFLKKVWAFFAFYALSFFKKPIRAWYCQRIFPERIPLLSFFLFFSITEVSKNLIGKEWQKQWCGGASNRSNNIRLCAVRELIAQLCCVMSGWTRESFGKMGKPVRAEMMLIEASY